MQLRILRLLCILIIFCQKGLKKILISLTSKRGINWSNKWQPWTQKEGERPYKSEKREFLRRRSRRPTTNKQRLVYV